ncbi:MAG: hypothetical protein ABL931_19970, partial [Usitatibacteraceae bacterium]
LLTGCAATKVDVIWSNPEFAASKIEGKIMVVGLTRDQTMRRVYEDGLVAQFAARGLGTKVNVVRSYEFVEGAFAADGTKTILEAARRQGATAVLSSAVVGHEHITRVTIDEPLGRWYGAYDGWYQHYWPYLYRRADVQVTQRYLASTTLIDVATGKIRWTARSHTDASGNVDEDIKGFASAVMDALAKNGLL